MLFKTDQKLLGISLGQHSQGPVHTYIAEGLKKGNFLLRRFAYFWETILLDPDKLQWIFAFSFFHKSIPYAFVGRWRWYSFHFERKKGRVRMYKGTNGFFFLVNNVFSWSYNMWQDFYFIVEFSVAFLLLKCTFRGNKSFYWHWTWVIKEVLSFWGIFSVVCVCFFSPIEF